MLHWLSDLLRFPYPLWLCYLTSVVCFFLGRWSYKQDVLESLDGILEESLSNPGSGQRGSQ